MIRASVAAAMLATPAAAVDCAATRDFVMASMGVNGMVVRSAGELSGEETCRIEGLSFDQGDALNITVDVLEWTLEGIGNEGFSDRVSLDLTARDARMVTKTEDRWVNYLLAEQARRNTIDADLGIVWEPRAGVLEIGTLSVDLPGSNGFTVTSTTRGVPETILLGQPPRDLAVEALDITVENTGFLDGLLISFLVERVRSVPGDPRRVMDATLGEVAEMIGAWPTSVFTDNGREDLQAMVLDGPAPWGRLSLSLDAPNGIGIDRLTVAATEPLGAADALETLFEGATISVTYTALEPE